jgi:FkbM family methyltransferase
MEIFKQTVRRLRAIPILNRPSTSTIRAACRLAGGAPGWVIRHMVRSGPVRSALPNGRTLKLWTKGDDWISNEVFWKGWNGYESDTSPFFYDLAAKSMVVFDVGAHVGYYSILAGLANPASKVYAFEPLPRAVQRFRKNLNENKIDNVELIECAVGECSGEAPYYCLPDTSIGIPLSSGLSNMFFEQPGSVRMGIRPRITAKVIRLDDFVKERWIERVDLVKIDTESTEPDVLRGMSAILKRDHPDLIFEVLPHPDAGERIGEALRPFDYKYYLLTDHGAEERSHIRSDQLHRNYLARSPKRAPRSEQAPGWRA